MTKQPLYPHKTSGASNLRETSNTDAEADAKKILKLNNSWNIRSAIDIAEGFPLKDYPELRTKLRQMLPIAYEVDKLLENIIKQQTDPEFLRKKYGPNYK